MSDRCGMSDRLGMSGRLTCLIDWVCLVDWACLIDLACLVDLHVWWICMSSRFGMSCGCDMEDGFAMGDRLTGMIHLPSIH